MMAQYPSHKIAELSYRYRTLGLGYANLGGLLMASGIAYDSHKARALAGAITALMTGTAYAVSAEMAEQLGAFAGFGANREAMLRVIRNHRRAAHGEKRDYEGLAVRPVALDAERVPVRELVEAARTGLGRGARARRGARLPQRPDHGDRADRHDRPGHGLRHHRHRARLRAGQVQEARRRRLLQDHQPDGAQGAQGARLRQRADRRHRALRGRPRHADRRARDQPREPRRQGLHARGARAPRARAARRLRHQVRLQPLHPRRDLLPRGARHHRRPARRPRLRPARRARLLARPVRGRQPVLLRRHDGRGRAAPPATSTSRCSTAPTPVAASASAISRPRATSA